SSVSCTRPICISIRHSPLSAVSRPRSPADCAMPRSRPSTRWSGWRSSARLPSSCSPAIYTTPPISVFGRSSDSCAASSGWPIADLAAAGLDYWALGHIHQHLRLAEGNPWIVYPGSLQAGKSNEVGPHGAVLVEAAGSVVERVDFIELDRVRFTHAEVDIAGEADLNSLRKTILTHADSVGRDLLLTVDLTGRGPLHRDLRRPGAVDDLLRDVRDE